MASTTRPNVFKSKPSVGHSRQKMLFPRLHPRLGIEFVFVIIVIEPAIENRNDTVPKVCSVPIQLSLRSIQSDSRIILVKTRLEIRRTSAYLSGIQSLNTQAENEIATDIRMKF